MGLAWPSGANAALITQIGTSGGQPGGQPVYEVSGLTQGDSLALTWGGVDGLGVDGMVFIDTLTSTDANISITLNNTSDPISGDDPRVTIFGVSIADIDTGDPFNTTNAGGSFLTFASASNFPGFSVDACATSGENCAAGGAGGIPAGSSDTFVLSVNGAFGETPLLTLNSFGIKIQGGPGVPAENSYELAGVPTVAPVPAALPLFLSALAGLGFFGWRRRTRVAA